jgi:hypothetical protein
VRPWIKYSLIRLALFAVVLAALLLIQVPWLWATVISAIVGFCVSYIFLRGPRAEFATSIAERRAAGSKNTDQDEDDALDRDE